MIQNEDPARKNSRWVAGPRRARFETGRSTMISFARFTTRPLDLALARSCGDNRCLSRFRAAAFSTNQ
jgi:hypothetical protein